MKVWSKLTVTKTLQNSPSKSPYFYSLFLSELPVSKTNDFVTPNT